MVVKTQRNVLRFFVNKGRSEVAICESWKCFEVAVETAFLRRASKEPVSKGAVSWQNADREI